MAEYSMTYQEIKEFVESCIDKCNDNKALKQHQAEILAAITSKDDDNASNNTAITKSLELWENQLGAPSELLLGTRYIVIKDSIIKFFSIAATSGLLDAIILARSTPENPLAGFSISVGASVVEGLIGVFQSAAQLEDSDFCVYMQALTHFRQHKDFTIEDLNQWFPHANNKTCNMHNSKWDCDHLIEDDICTMLQGDNLSNVLDSLYNKKILNRRTENGKQVYSFKW